MKTISQTLGVARSNVIERRDGHRPRRGPQERPGDVELAGAIRRFVDERPTYGYRRIAALLKRERRSDGLAPINVKRVYRLMKKHGLLLERHTGRRRPREHDGQVATIRSNCRWCSDALEFTCWNGEVVRVAFALDCHDREAISWVATTAGISGEMIRDMMVRSVEQRFGSLWFLTMWNGCSTQARTCDSAFSIASAQSRRALGNALMMLRLMAMFQSTSRSSTSGRLSAPV